jgi:glyoxylate reductase
VCVLGVKVSNTPGAVDDATATTALYLIVSTLRQFSKAERNLRNGTWKSGLNSGRAFDLTDKTLAILGMGGIGTRIAELVHAFPMRVIYHNRRPAEGAPPWTEYYPKEKLAEFLKEADVLALSIPLRPETEGLVGEAMIRGLRKGAILVNTARGKVIDEDAMIRALEDGHVGLLVTPLVLLLICLVGSLEGWVWMFILTSRR